MKATFQTPECCFDVEFNYSPAAQEICKHIPLDSKVNLWGDELYFETGIIVSPAIPAETVGIGDVAYWPDGRCICVFFGPTPLSSGADPVPAGPVIIIGKTKVNIPEFKRIREGDPIRVMPVQEQKNQSDVSAAGAERKLSQEEIDVLVRRLLEEKKKKEQPGN